MNSGEVIGGKYVVEHVLGEGGMGVVVAARHAQLGNLVAVKMILSEFARHPDVVARFEREARAAAELSSEHVARVTDFGCVEDGSPYLVMEYLDGEDLGERIERGRIPIGDAIRYFTEACLGLGEAHELGIVHRDIKPSNLFIARKKTGREVLKVLDFGIAKAESNSNDRALTRTSAVIGSPQYMSPEQLRDSKSVDRRTDIWSLGAAMYEVLTGTPAFPSESLAELHLKILTSDPRDIREARPDCPTALNAAVLRCLAKDPDSRPASMLELHQLLTRIQEGGSPSGVQLGSTAFDETRIPSGPNDAHRSHAGAATSQGFGVSVPLAAAVLVPTQEWGHRKRTAVLGVTGGVVAATLFAAFTFRSRGPGAEPSLTQTLPAPAVAPTGTPESTIARGTGTGMPSPPNAEAALALVANAIRDIGSDEPVRWEAADRALTSAEALDPSTPRLRELREEVSRKRDGARLKGRASSAAAAGMALIPGGNGVAEFELDITEVTVAAYRQCVKAGACSAAGLSGESLLGDPPEAGNQLRRALKSRCTYSSGNADDMPLNCVDWNQARAYCEWKGRRLPTEPERLWAATGATGAGLPWGTDAARERLCWRRFDQYRSSGPYVEGPCRAGSSPDDVSVQGVRDLAANLTEWTSTHWRNGDRVEKGQHIAGGGSWRTIGPEEDVVRGSGFATVATERFAEVGFRCAR